MARPRVHDDAVRRRLLEIASEVVSTDGPAALGLRDVARRADTSTTAVYALFGSHADLLAAVSAEGFRRFAAHLDAVPRTDDARGDLLALGLAYRASALADRHFYRVMFEVPVPPDAGPDTAAAAQPTFATLHRAVARVLAAPGGADAASDVAAVLWAHVHGFVALELAGHLPVDPTRCAEIYEASLRALGTAVLGPPSTT